MFPSWVSVRVDFNPGQARLLMSFLNLSILTTEHACLVTNHVGSAHINANGLLTFMGCTLAFVVRDSVWF